MLSEHKPGERLNLIGYSGGATPVANAACLLSRRGVSINNLVTIGAVTFRSRSTNVARWDDVVGDFDPVYFTPILGGPDHTTTIALTTHTTSFTSSLGSTVGTVMRRNQSSMLRLIPAKTGTRAT